jgi:hypothetical protein
MLVGWSQNDSAAGLRRRCERKQLRSRFSLREAKKPAVKGEKQLGFGP